MDTLKTGAQLHGTKRTYTIKSQLGHGGFGITYLAEAETVDVDGIPQIGKYCIKEFFLSGKCSRDESGKVIFEADAKTVQNGKSDFEAEANALVSLNKVPGIVSVSEIIKANNTVYYVMAFLEGQSLEKMIQAKGRLNETEALPIIRKVAEALKVLHDKKMTHLDVKPENIMVVNRGGELQPVLIDFGLSRSYNMFGKESLGKRLFAVSDGYSPVEQYGMMTGFTPQADVYALAATLLHALTGQMPAKADEISESQIEDALTKCGVGEQTRNAIERAMRQDVGLRTKSVEQFLNDLTTKTSGGGRETKTIGEGGGTKSNSLRYAIIAAVAVVAGIVLYNLFGGNKGGGAVSDQQHDGEDTAQVEPTPVPATGSLKIEYNPSDLEVWINEEKKGSATEVFNDLAAGSYKVELRKSGYENRTLKVDIEAGKTATLKGSLTKKQPVSTDDSSTTTTTPTTPSIRTLQIGDYATWRGGVKNGKPHGQGTMTFKKQHQIDSYCEEVAKEGDTVTGTYEDGHLVNGKWYSAGQAPKTLIP